MLCCSFQLPSHTSGVSSSSSGRHCNLWSAGDRSYICCTVGIDMVILCMNLALTIINDRNNVLLVYVEQDCLLQREVTHQKPLNSTPLNLTHLPLHHNPILGRPPHLQSFIVYSIIIAHYFLYDYSQLHYFLLHQLI